MPFIVAVDGPAASGKGTVASALARHFSLPYLDTGLLYRAVGVGVQDLGGDLSEETAATRVAEELEPEALDNPRLRSRAAGEAASRVAIYAPVRSALLAFQRAFASQGSGAVLDGRDIGTVIVPDAPAKLFVTARPEVRAERRWKQLNGQGESVSFDDVLDDICKRDERDSGRATAPLIQAGDARLLDTSEMSIDTAFREALRLVEQMRGS